MPVAELGDGWPSARPPTWGFGGARVRATGRGNRNLAPVANGGTNAAGKTSAVGTVVALSRYPVKSMLGEDADSAVVSERGLAGDRAYALVDRDTGTIASAKHPRIWGRLLDCRAAFATLTAPGPSLPPVRITLPDGRAVVAGQDDVDRAISTLLGREVNLLAAAPPAAEMERYWPDIDGLLARDKVTAGAIALGAPAGSFFDHAPIHLLPTASLDRPRASYPAGRFEARRFRPNLLVGPASGANGFAENAWVGRKLLVGEEVRLRVTDPSPRCVVTTLPQADLPRDLGILKAIVAQNRVPIPALDGQALPSVGVYMAGERGGIVHVGDPVR